VTAGQAPPPVRVLYFAWVREKAGIGAEQVVLPATVTDVGGLIAWLRARGGGQAAALADLGRLRVAVNQEHVAFDHPLAPGDEVAFFPPVTGG
jgi:sulfur-carrier protein